MKSVHRLFDAFIPKHYDLHLSLDRKKRVFTGTVIVTGVSTLSDGIHLHSKNLSVIDALIDGKTVKTSVGQNDILILHDDVSHGEHTVTITFKGEITDSMHGLYPGYYTHDGHNKELLVTQFESHHAREVFPCIDEPEAKATFSLSIEAEKDVQVLSNTPAISKEHTSRTTITYFDMTPRMSTYLLAFVVGEFHRVHATTKSGVEVSVYSTHVHALSSLEFSLDIAVRGIEFFETYFDTPYPLPKCDHIAIPDFSAGAMENWGLITYRERVLVAKQSESQSAKELIASVICHELSHQWFGNLVTMRWWDDLWLNESFANLMEYIAVDALEPSWDIWQTFASKEATSALSRDYLAGVQPVKMTVRHPDEIATLFDPAIVYAKGSRLLKMLQHYVGHDAFRKGLQDYFQTFQYGNTVSDDLWRSLSTHSHKDIGELMNTWIQQSGFPVVDLTTTPSGYTATQERLVVGARPDKRLWNIPLSPYQKDFPTLLDSKSRTFNAKHHLPFLNVESSTHFVTRYDERSFALILSGLREGKLSTVDRLSLLFETVLLAKSQKIPLSDVLVVASEFKDDNTESVWSIINHGISEIRRVVENGSDEAILNTFVIALTETQLQRLSSTVRSSDSDSDKKLRALLCSMRLQARDTMIIDHFTGSNSPKQLESLQGELRTVTYKAIAMYGSADDFATLLSLHKETNDPLLKADLVDGITCTTDPDHIALLLHHLTDTSIVKPQDTIRWFVGLMRNAAAREQTWEWMLFNWEFIIDTFKGDKIYESFARYSASALNSPEEYESYKKFFEPKRDDVALERTITIALHELRNRVEVIKKNKIDILETLHDFVLSPQEKLVG